MQLVSYIQWRCDLRSWRCHVLIIRIGVRLWVGKIFSSSIHIHDTERQPHGYAALNFHNCALKRVKCNKAIVVLPLLQLGYGLDGLDFESFWDRGKGLKDLSLVQTSQPSRGSNQPPIQWITKLFPGGYRGWKAMLITHLYLPPKLVMSGSI